MASQTFTRPSNAIPLADFAAHIGRRRQETGINALPRNAGGSRTASKKALLAAIDVTGGNGPRDHSGGQKTTRAVLGSLAYKRES